MVWGEIKKNSRKVKEREKNHAKMKKKKPSPKAFPFFQESLPQFSQADVQVKQFLQAENLPPSHHFSNGPSLT
jgi:hypothetical protein